MHLHFETRYYGQSFDPERLIDFKNGTLSRETFLLKKSFFSIYSNAGQDFDDEIANEEQDKKEAAEKAAMKYYKIRSGDTLFSSDSFSQHSNSSSSAGFKPKLICLAINSYMRRYAAIFTIKRFVKFKKLLDPAGT